MTEELRKRYLSIFRNKSQDLEAELEIERDLRKRAEQDLTIERNLRQRLKEELQFFETLVPLPKIIQCEDCKQAPIGEPGVVYFIYSVADPNCIKIGKTQNLPRRIKQLQTGNPSDLKLLGYIIGYTDIEKLYKRYYQQFRTQEGGKEWYRDARFRFKWIDD
ncbi:MAG: GIY-YIG nuclease family protein [Dolichospermum sp. DET50]|jgi:hypothetical protein|nr:GIY-YIG nuclease family protein [Dolichospermum sp. DET66]MBS3034998.1 GIY-YIG nuclease family protein [Dolichospermum sp. DET67]MBS3040198.1 GIY-YIG nuclease family protein [Dolichospermum sp. DET50]QSX67368.1 MAG: GIY-YIG nuclease family protein [Dolichospermum sp. DET69]